MAISVLVVPMNYAGEIVFSGAAESGLTLPGGPLDGDETPAAAARSLQAQTGFRAEVTFPLGTLTLAERPVHLYLARNLVPVRPMSDPIFNAATHRVPLDDIEAVIAAGHLQDAVTIAALFLARSFITGKYHPDIV